MDSIRFLAKSLLFWLVRVGVSWPLVTMCVRDVEEVASAPGGGRRRTLLALNPERFREDLDILAATGELRLLKLPFHWPGRLITHFYPAGVSTAQIARPAVTQRCYTVSAPCAIFSVVFCRLFIVV